MSKRTSEARAMKWHLQRKNVSYCGHPETAIAALERAQAIFHTDLDVIYYESRRRKSRRRCERELASRHIYALHKTVACMNRPGFKPFFIMFCRESTNPVDLMFPNRRAHANHHHRDIQLEDLLALSQLILVCLLNSRLYFIIIVILVFWAQSCALLIWLLFSLYLSPIFVFCVQLIFVIRAQELSCLFLPLGYHFLLDFAFCFFFVFIFYWSCLALVSSWGGEECYGSRQIPRLRAHTTTVYSLYLTDQLYRVIWRIERAIGGAYFVVICW
jgi:hypothetical protein